MNRLLLLIPLLLTAWPALAGDRVYHYATTDGVPLFTDRRIAGQRLIAIREYGRPTAVSGRCNLNSKHIRKRIQRYAPLIHKLAARHHIDESLIKAVITTESCFNPRAVSRVGARGLMQLMPDTAAMLGVSDPFDPAQNLDGGVRYLRMMLDQFNQDKRLALAAYNAGPEAVKKYGNTVPPYRETRHYVRKILKMLD